MREIGFLDWGGQNNFSEARLFSPKNPRNFSQARVFFPKIPRIFSKARFFPLKFSNFWGIWAPKQLSKAGVEQARVIYYLSYTSEARRGKNIGGAMAPLAPPLPPSLFGLNLLFSHLLTRDRWRRNFDQEVHVQSWWCQKVYDWIFKNPGFCERF